MEQRISLVTLGVRDLARARAFYEALGWRGAQQPDNEVAFYQAGGMVFGLWAALGGHGAPGVELAHNVRSPSEVDAVLAAAVRACAVPREIPSRHRTSAATRCCRNASGKPQQALAGGANGGLHHHHGRGCLPARGLAPQPADYSRTRPPFLAGHRR
ncbi:MAG: hypothetical protein E6J05_05360 [Chloroflexi bacterium]|nr:MAG: hypothetical protein E6J05_05360 [Chloroflexota bacterium]